MRTYLRVLPALLLLVPSVTSAASIYLDPDTGKYGPGDTFVVSVRLDNEGACINAAHVAITYPTASLRAADFGRGGSIFSLWAEEPKIDTDKGLVTFSGGIPGGYCGRIPGDPALSNVLGKVVFTVVGTGAPKATIHLMRETEGYLNDGLGTKLSPTLHDASVTIGAERTTSEDPWVKEVGKDTTPPEAFDIQVESTRGVLGGKYYIVFSTIDKQSGIDHFEILENGSWSTVTSPYVLKDQNLTSGIRVKAIDKAGNERIGTYAPGAVPPPRQSSFDDYSLLLALAVVVTFGGAWLFIRSKKKESEVTPIA